MKKIYNSFKIAFSMYSRIPMRHIEWSEENMSYVMCFFPWIGAVIGGVTYLVFHLQSLLNGSGICFHGFFYTALLVLIPILITGGIHMDGFLDTKDALSSYQSMERRLEILKDPHAGAFAIIYGVVYFVCYLGVYSSLSARSVIAIGMSFMLSRTLSALSIVTFPQARKKGMAADVSGGTSKQRTKNVLVIYLVILTACLCGFGTWCGIAALMTAFVTFGRYRKMAMEMFGGVTGDLAGYFLQRCELFMAMAAVICDVILRGLGV